jgi:hypothetical protein
MARKEYWVPKAFEKKKGSLRRHVKKEYGSAGFRISSATGKPIIKSEVLQSLAKEKNGFRTAIGRKARLALRARKFKKRGRKKGRR